jgi:hypothetical protein
VLPSPLVQQEADGQIAQVLFLFYDAVSRKMVYFVMTDQDLLTIALLLFAVLAILLVPPGPGTPLRDRLQGSKA